MIFEDLFAKRELRFRSFEEMRNVEVKTLFTRKIKLL
jgi:hypothetical protein